MADKYRLRFDWSLLDGAERASQTIHVLGPDDDLLTLMAGVLAAVNLEFPTIDQEYDSSTVLTRCVGSRLQALAPWHAQETVETTLNKAGTQNYASLPPQLSIVATLKTASAARSGRGRIYFPPPIATKLESNSRIPSATVDAFGNYTSGIVQDLNALAGGPWSVCVFSRTYNGGMTPVTGVQVGDVYDTQRRRRDDLIEVRQNFSV